MMSRYPLFFAASTLVVLLSAETSTQAQSPFNNTMPTSPMGQRGAGLPANALPPRGSDRSAPPAAQPVYGGNNGGGIDPALLAALGGGSAPMSLENVGPEYKLRRGDVVSYQVREDRDPMVAIPVTDSGEIDVPYLGRRSAVGKTCGQLQTEVKSALERELYVRATVQLGLNRVSPTQSRGRVYMTGQIRTIGPLELPTDEALTVSKAVLRAGGFRDFANQRKVQLIRKDGPSKGIEVDVKGALLGKRVEDPVLQPGDTVNVPEKLVNF